MKVILFGSTGFIGKGVLVQCLKNPDITSIIAVSRRDLPEADTNPKLTVIIVDNFMVYPDSILEQLKDADACIWSIGTYNWDPIIELDYPNAFQEAISEILDVKKKLRYVYLGGAFTELDTNRTLLFFAKTRQLRGLAQSRFLEFANQNENVEPYVVRPAAVLPKDGSFLVRILFSTMSVQVDELAAAMVDLAVNGGNEQVLEHKTIVEKGRDVLMKQK